MVWPKPNARLYIDTEFNGHGGQLISMGIASADHELWYRELPEPSVWNEWCRANVLPMLAGTPVEIDVFRASLKMFMSNFDTPTIYADWPADFEHLMAVMAGPSFEQSWSQAMNLVLLPQTDPKPRRPHNALSDAEALRDWHMDQLKK